MNDTKSIFASVTFWGAILSVAGVVAGMAHVSLGDTTAFAGDIAALVGAGISVYGRITAVKKIG